MQNLLEQNLQEQMVTMKGSPSLSEGINVEALGEGGRESAAELEADAKVQSVHGKSRSARAWAVEKAKFDRATARRPVSASRRCGGSEWLLLLDVWSFFTLSRVWIKDGTAVINDVSC